MALASGTRFGSYEVGEAIGAGGMGEVYRAHDTTLERDVAIKVLPASFAEDADRIERFEREAKTLASLNHPNIAQIHGLENSDSTTAIVMELIEGPTLADRIAEGPLPADEALGIAMQIADALEAAHGQGIVHRDLKPANVKVRTDGTVKVLDFGIAKALDLQATSGPGAPAMTTPAMTQTGIILGTAAYMSPEQARGKLVDDRTDVWAFGCLLYEMLTGQPAFAGEDVALTLARILANDTDMKSLPAAISPAVRQTIELCLRKDPRKRIADIRDVRLALEGSFDTIEAQGSPKLVEHKPVWRRALPVAAAIVTALLGLVSGSLWLGPEPEQRPVVRFDYDVPSEQLIRTAGGRHFLALSPTGRHFAYNTTDGFYIRAMNELDARLIPGTETGSSSPVFSPDGQWIAYVEATGQLKRVAITGGAPVVLTEELSNPRGMSWAVDDTILLALPDGILQVSSNGGTPEVIVPAANDDSGRVLVAPEFLPNGEAVIFTRQHPADISTAEILVHTLTTGEQRLLVSGASEAHYLPSGHLIYMVGDSLFAVAFDLATLSVSGGAIPLVQGILRSDVNRRTNYSVSSDGTLAYATGSLSGETRMLVWVDREGREDPISAAPLRTYTNARISPDGSTVALDIRDQELDIWTWNLARETLTRLTFDAEQDESPVWSPDGRTIAYTSTPVAGTGSATVVLSRNADGTGAVVQLAESPGQAFTRSFSPDASALFVYGREGLSPNGDDIGVVSLEGDDGVMPLLATPFEESYPVVSPDGRWLAYVSDESGNEQVYVRPYPAINEGRWQTSVDEGTQPVWAPDGSELFYRDGQSVMRVELEADTGFLPGNPEALFDDEYVMAQGGPNYDVSPIDGRFLMIKSVEDASAAVKIIVVENWLSEIERLLPTE